MVTPYLTIDLDKIEHNARTIVELCKQHGIEVTGVTKGVCGHPAVAQAMLRGGVFSIADSRTQNIRRMQAAGIDTSYMLLRLAPLSGVEDVVKSVDISLNSELTVLEGLSEAASRLDKVHDVILMLDLGDLREGIWPDDLVAFVKKAVRLPGIRIKGVGTNLACFGGVVPSEENMNRLVQLAEQVERTFDLKLECVSGINSSGLDLISAGGMPKRINHARIGEAILLGCETTHRKSWPGTFQDAFVLNAEVLELKKKPSLPLGERGEDAFGKMPEFKDRGEVLRALLNVGHEDVDIDGIAPLDTGIKILGGSTGYLVVDVSATKKLRVGDIIAFSLNYSALVAVMTSEYVDKRLMRAG